MIWMSRRPSSPGHRCVTTREDAIGKVVHVGCLLIDCRKVQRTAAGFADDAAIGKGMLLKVHPAFGTLDAELVGGVIEAGYRVTLRSAGKVHSPADGFFHFVEEVWLGLWLLVRCD